MTREARKAAAYLRTSSKTNVEPEGGGPVAAAIIWRAEVRPAF